MLGRRGENEVIVIEIFILEEILGYMFDLFFYLENFFINY